MSASDWEKVMGSNPPGSTNFHPGFRHSGTDGPITGHGYSHSGTDGRFGFELCWCWRGDADSSAGGGSRSLLLGDLFGLNPPSHRLPAHAVLKSRPLYTTNHSVLEEQPNERH